MSWLKQSKGECPQCKKLSVELRALDFDQTTALLSSNTEIRADLQAAAEIRRRKLVELNETWHSVLEDLKSSTQRQQDAEKQADEAKLERRELQEQETRHEARREVIQEELDEVQKRCAMTRFHLDQSNQRQNSKLPALTFRQDAQCERRKLHQAQQAGLRASDRANDLHRQLISAFKQYVELQSLARKRQVAAAEAEAVVRSLRSQVEHRRKRTNEIQDESLDFSSNRSDVSSVPLKTPSPGLRSLHHSIGSPSSPSSPAVAKVLNVLHRRPATPNSSAAGGRKRTTPEDDEEDTLLFGGPAKMQRKGSGGFGKATVKPVQRTPSTQPQVVTTKTKKSNLKSLFDPV